MHRLIFLVFLILQLSVVYSQYAGKGVKDINRLLSKSNKILVVLSGDEKFDNNLVYSLEKYWKIGGWDTMSLKTWKDLKKVHPSQLLLVFNLEMLRESSSMINSRGGFGGVKSAYQNAKYQLEYGLIQKKEAFKPFDVTADPLVFDVINYHGIEENGLGMAYRLPITIFNIQNVLHMVMENEIKKPIIDNFSNINNRLEALYCENAGILKEKILLLNSDEKKLIDEDDIKDYPYKYEFASRERIEDLIKEKNANYAFLHLACHTYKYITIYDLGTYVPLYSYMNQNPIKCKLKPNISEIVDAIKNSNTTEIRHNYLSKNENIETHE